MSWVNTMIGNVKNATRGSYHEASGEQLPRYLSQFYHRLNRRVSLVRMRLPLNYGRQRRPANAISVAQAGLKFIGNWASS